MSKPVPLPAALAEPSAPPSAPISPGPPGDRASSDAARAGREALARHAWTEAYEQFVQADGEGDLSGGDLEAFADAAFFSGHADRQMDIGERAVRAYLAAGDEVRAAFIATSMAHGYVFANKPSIALAWIRRAERLLEGKPETYVHGHVALLRSDEARAKGNIDEALALAEAAVAIAGRVRDADLQAMSMSELGSLKISTGATSDGVALMEEASISAVNGELSPFITGVTTCRMIAACRDLTDYRRASEWTEATERWCERQSVSGFPGVCRVHRAEMVTLAGEWDRAERELGRATDELAAYQAIQPLSDGYYAIGEVRRLKGDLEGAEKALRQAHAYGKVPQPALALIRLAEGKVKAASAAISSALDDEPWNQVARTRLLPALVEIAIAAGDLGRARAASDELGAIIEQYQTPALKGVQKLTLGRVLLAEGDPAGAARELRAAIRDWREVGATYEVARSQALLSAALRALDDEDAADLELEAARDQFVRLGARLDAEAAERAAKTAADRRSTPAQVRRTFMFTDIVGSTNLAEALGNESWEQLLRWHDDRLRELIARGGGEVVNSTGDGFFVAFESADASIGCARAIQRALADHRRTSGFALSVRIGVHSAEANRRGEDYSGVGVHLAARVAALAKGGEIIATADTLETVPG
ncbi:MAG: adenylate/guanylate cyclase domain-containing protein, partial [Chloroflexi bacterium]